MVSSVVTIEPGTRPDQDLNEAPQLMDQHELERILVVEGDRVVGIISEAAICSDEGPLA
jgi:CBS domain-containing protein